MFYMDFAVINTILLSLIFFVIVVYYTLENAIWRLHILYTTIVSEQSRYLYIHDLPDNYLYRLQIKLIVLRRLQYLNSSILIFREFVRNPEPEVFETFKNYITFLCFVELHMLRDQYNRYHWEYKQIIENTLRPLVYERGVATMITSHL
jgi:hypothetical protein